MWTIDRIAYDNLEPLSILGAAAGATQKIRLGTSVLLGNTRHPAHLAKIIATLDFISNGRVTIGLGFRQPRTRLQNVEIPMSTAAPEPWSKCNDERLWTEDNVTPKAGL